MISDGYPYKLFFPNNVLSGDRNYFWLILRGGQFDFVSDYGRLRIWLKIFRLKCPKKCVFKFHIDSKEEIL